MLLRINNSPAEHKRYQIQVMKMYSFSGELESAVIELLEDTTFLLPQLSNSDTPAYVKALRQLKATRPSVFQISTTAAKSDHPGDKNDCGKYSQQERRLPNASTDRR